MDYKYQRRQIFGKRLKVPKHILNKVYSCTLSFNEYIEYQLDDKIPTSCIRESDRRILEKFGIDRCKELDWELINKQVYYNTNIDFRDILMSIDSQTQDINSTLYELVKNEIKPVDYTPKMREVYSDRLFDVSQNNDENLRYIINDFNEGKISLMEIIYNWDLFKNKDLSYCLLNDNANKNNITNNMLKEFMSSYGELASLIGENNDIYTIIEGISKISNESEKNIYLRNYTDNVLDKTLSKNSGDTISLTNEQYKLLFKYSSVEDYLKRHTYYEHYVDNILKELQTLNMSTDYLFEMPIPFIMLKNNNVLTFIGTYGLKNVVDFDNECEHFFTNNQCEMLRMMNDMYLHYANWDNSERSFFTKKNNDDRPYTKDEFYEAMKRMIVYGPTNSKYLDKAPDYRNMKGEFKIRNQELFISDDAPEELQQLFYTKSITPGFISQHPDYIQFLNDKNLVSCFRRINVSFEDDVDKNFYNFLETKADFNGVMNFIMDYGEVLDMLFYRTNSFSNQYEIKFQSKDDMKQISEKINKCLRKLIIEKGAVYPKHIPQKMLETYPTMFLPDNSPSELKDAFYNRTITTGLILSNPAYRQYIKDVELEFLFKYMPVKVKNGDNYDNINLVSGISNIFGEDGASDVMILYGKYIEKVFEDNMLRNFQFDSNSSKDALLDELDNVILLDIIDGKMKYDEKMSSHFKNNYPTMFLPDNVSENIKDKFYKRNFTIKDFSDNPELIDIFNNTNIACGFAENMSWIIPLFKETENLKQANLDRLRVILEYSKIQDVALQDAFKEYVMGFGKTIDFEKIGYVSEVLSRLSLSNSSEIFTFKNELATQILKSNNPLESLSKIEDVFIRDNVPTIGKIYSCFEILHPDFQGFDFEEISMISPVLKKSSNLSRKVIVFSDLIKSSFGSNNKSVNAYLKNIEIGSNLYESIKLGQIQFDSLGEVEGRELTTFCSHLATLYNNTMKVKKSNEIFKSTGYVLNDILELAKKLSPDGTLDYNLADRVIRMFCGFTGIDTLAKAKEYIERKVSTADSKNRNASSSDMTLEQGDFIKGIGGIKYLRNILQNGSVSKEYLGSSASSDFTPLDTDISMIMSSEGTIREKIGATAASKYGPIWFVLKNDDRFITTRTSDETLEAKRDMSKMEVFYTGVCGQDHYGIRTGFASSEINYILMEDYDPRVGLEIAMNGFYIPVSNKEGKIVFTPKDYDELRTKMSGLSYFDENNYTFSENLITEETKYFAEQIEQSNFEVQAKREKINNVIKKSLEELGLYLKTNIDGVLTEGFVELIDTGSTGRGTNKPGDGDFDFMMRLDKTILSNPTRLNELKQTILRNLGRENSSELTGTGDFRLKSVQIGTDMSVDIDITFTEKTDKVSYSTDMALQDRLATIQRNDPEKYKYVVANILLAKQVLKKAEAYKPYRGEIPQGGLGGVGIENWILQNGGSFIDAAKSFVDAADGKSFSEFRSTYQIWDFGENHLAEKRGLYSHDNFVSNNMSEAGYQKMVQALKEYLKSMKISQIDTETKKR